MSHLPRENHAGSARRRLLCAALALGIVVAVLLVVYAVRPHETTVDVPSVPISEGTIADGSQQGKVKTSTDRAPTFASSQRANAASIRFEWKDWNRIGLFAAKREGNRFAWSLSELGGSKAFIVSSGTCDEDIVSSIQQAARAMSVNRALTDGPFILQVSIEFDSESVTHPFRFEDTHAMSVHLPQDDAFTKVWSEARGPSSKVWYRYRGKHENFGEEAEFP